MDEMRHDLPTHLIVEPTFMGPFDVVQFLCLAAGACGAAACWFLLAGLPPSLRAALGAACPLAGALCCWRPGGHALPLWGLLLCRYAATPRRSVCRPRVARPEEWLPPEDGWATATPGLALAPGRGEGGAR